MESLDESNHHSLSDGFSLHDCYLKKISALNSFLSKLNTEVYSTSYEYSNVDNVHSPEVSNIEVIQPGLQKQSDFLQKANSLANSLTSSSTTLTDRSDVHDSSEDIKPSITHLFLTSTMENSNNAVDSVPLFSEVQKSGNVFKLPNNELSFNGTIYHVQKMQPIVDPLTALCNGNTFMLQELNHCCLTGKNFELNNTQLDNNQQEQLALPVNSEASMKGMENKSDQAEKLEVHINNSKTTSSSFAERSELSYPNQFDKQDNSAEPNEPESLQTAEISPESTKVDVVPNNSSNSEFVDKSRPSLDHVDNKNNDQSYSSLEGSFDSGLRSPDMFSDGEEVSEDAEAEPFWSFMKDYEAYDKRKTKKLESECSVSNYETFNQEKLKGILPPPSVTIIKTDVTEMLKRYYDGLLSFDNNAPGNDIGHTQIKQEMPITPTKRVSFVEIPQVQDNIKVFTKEEPKLDENLKDEKSDELDTSVSDKSIVLKLYTEAESKETIWPDVIKCRFFDVYYNVTSQSEKLERLALRYGERFVGAETDTSVCIYSGGQQSPNSASKRKALRLKMQQAKSPGRRLSHLARRRQAFCSAATIGEKASTSKMVYIDKNFFPHRKLINSSERKSPRIKRTPGKKTPGRKTPVGKRTPAKTPKTRSGGSSRKKALSRLDSGTKPTLRRALFLSPENRQPVPQVCASSVPAQAMRTKRALFSSPTANESKGMDGSQSEHALKRKRELFDSGSDRRSKIAKSLSFGGDSLGCSSGHSSQIFTRRASEVITSKSKMVELNELHRKKLVWAVTEALRLHNIRMSCAGFRTHAAALAQLTRRLLGLPPHAARLAQPQSSTSDTMFKLARQYSFAIIQGRSVDDCFEEEKAKIASEASGKVSGYISAAAYQQLQATQSTSSQLKENSHDSTMKQEPRSGTKHVLQDKFNINSNSNSSSGLSTAAEKVGFIKSNSMPTFAEAAKMRVRRQISFDNIDFPKR